MTLLNRPHAVLGIKEGACEADVKRAYRNLALRWHPDKHPPQSRASAEEQFKAIGEAYNNLLQLVSDKTGNLARSARRQNAAAETSNAYHEGPATPPENTPSSGVDERLLRKLPPSYRVQFARGSACVGRAYKGLEGEELAKHRQDCIRAATAWTREGGRLASLEVSGSFDHGEVRSAQSSQLATARAVGTLRFWIKECGQDSSNCSTGLGITEGHQGIEIRFRLQVDVDGSFRNDTAAELKDLDSLDLLAELVFRCPQYRVQIEIGTGTQDTAGTSKIARYRCTEVFQQLSLRGVRKSSMHVRCRAGAETTARFFIYMAP